MLPACIGSATAAAKARDAARERRSVMTRSMNTVSDASPMTTSTAADDHRRHAHVLQDLEETE